MCFRETGVWGGNWGGNVFAFGRKLFDVLSETLRRLAVNPLAFERKRTCVWRSQGFWRWFGESWEAWRRWVFLVVEVGWNVLWCLFGFAFVRFAGLLMVDCFVCFLFEFVKGIWIAFGIWISASACRFWTDGLRSEKRKRLGRGSGESDILVELVEYKSIWA